jgi:hypothetical protein
VRREPAVDVVSREDLGTTDLPPASAAQSASPARDHRGNDDGPARERLRLGAGLAHDPRDLVAQDERERVAGLDALVEEGEIGVADAASRDFDERMPGRKGPDLPIDALERSVRGSHFEGSQLHAQAFLEADRDPSNDEPAVSAGLAPNCPLVSACRDA